MSEWLYPVTLPPVFLVHPDEKPEILQAETPREKEFKALPAWSERVFEDWCRDMVGDDTGLALIKIPKPVDWQNSVNNPELDHMIGIASKEIETILVSEGQASVKKFNLEDIFGPLPAMSSSLSGIGEESDVEGIIREEMMDLGKKQITTSVASAAVQMTLQLAGVVNPINSVVSVTQEPKDVKRWAELATTVGSLYESISGAAAVSAGAATGAGAGVSATAFGGAVAAGGITLIAVAAIVIGIDMYANRQSKRAAHKIGDRIQAIFDKDLQEIQGVVRDTVTMVVDSYKNMEIDIQEKTRLRKEEMKRAVLEAIHTGHGVIRTKRFDGLVPNELPLEETLEYKKVENRKQAAAIGVMTAIAIAQALAGRYA